MVHERSFGFLRLVEVRDTQVQVRRWTHGSHGLYLAMVWPKRYHRKCCLVVYLAFCVTKETQGTQSAWISPSLNYIAPKPGWKTMVGDGSLAKQAAASGEVLPWFWLGVIWYFP